VVFRAAITIVLASLAFLVSIKKVNGDSDMRELFLTYFNSPSSTRAPDPSGHEAFCVFRYSDDKNYHNQVSEFIETLNSIYSKNFTITHSRSFLGCPDDTIYFVMLGGIITKPELYDILEGISGKRPPSEFISTKNLRGFQTSIPGAEFRSFIYIREPFHSVVSNQNPFQSVMLEEILHALLDIGDFDSSEILSIFGKNLDVSDYAYWFQKNPKGLCHLDLFLLELKLGSGRHSAYSTPYLWYIDSGHTQHQKISSYKSSFRKYLDARCN